MIGALVQRIVWESTGCMLSRSRYGWSGGHALSWSWWMLGGFGVAFAGLVVRGPWSDVLVSGRATYVTGYLCVQTVCAVGVLTGAWRMRSAARRAWVLVAGAAVLSMLDDVAWELLAGPVGYGENGVGLGARAVVQVVSGLLVLSFPAVLLRMRLGGRSDREGFVDGLAIACAIGLVSWETLLWLPGGAAVVSDANVALFMLLTGVLSAALAMLVRLAFTGVHRAPSAWLLLAAVVTQACGVVVLGIGGAPHLGEGVPAELLNSVSFALLVAAAWHPSAERLTDPVDADELGARVSLGRLAMLAAALLMPGVVTSVRTSWLMFGGTPSGAPPAPIAVLPSSVAGLVIIVSVIWRMWRLVQDRERARELLRHRATHDDLTGLPNRRVLYDLLADLLTRSVDAGASSSFAVLFMDLDGFKAINDTLGHRAGDHVLVEVSRRVRAGLRDDDTLVRIAGDEFVAVCVGPMDVPSARTLADRVHAQIVAPIDIDGLEVTVGASIGVAQPPPPTGDATRDAQRLLHLADHAMYDAKRRGGGRTVVAADTPSADATPSGRQDRLGATRRYG